MSRPAGTPPWKLFCCSTVAVVCALSFATPSSALPGVGGLAKKAKEKAARAAGVKEEAAVGDNTVVFDDEVVELTDDRLGSVIAAFQKAKAASAGRPALVEKLNKVSEERGDLWEKQSEAIMEVQRKRGDVEICLHDGYREAQDRRTKEYTDNALTDPTIREKFTKIAQEYGAAAANGDSVAIKKAQEAMLAVAGPTHEDSLSVRKKCGPVPPPLPAEGKIAEMDKRIAALTGEIRAIDAKVSEAQAEGGGMESQQFAIATERIQMYLSWRGSKSYSKSATRGFTQEEIDALEKRLEELRAALG